MSDLGNIEVTGGIRLTAAGVYVPLATGVSHEQRLGGSEGFRMGLCLFVLGSDVGDDEPEEIAECDVGHYSDFACFRDTVAKHIDASRYPNLMEHSDCDGEWTPAEIPSLERELREIGAAFQKLSPEEPVGAFEHTAEYRAGADSLYDCFHNVDGENLFEALLELCNVAREHNRPITFR